MTLKGVARRDAEVDIPEEEILRYRGRARKGILTDEESDP